MKFFGVILLTGYFLGRERELFLPADKDLKHLLKMWAVYLACAGTAVFLGMIPLADARLQPALVLFSALIPAILFQGRAVCAFAGAATAFCVLRFAPDFNRVALMLVSAEAAVLIIAFFYQGARERMLRLFTPRAARGDFGALGTLFALAVLMILVWQKTIQIF